ncbi:MAG: PhoH family protein [Kiritimatiellae bacterium]|nr:PhoH family protein [Kiritimatiellia bacterium]
MIQHTIHFDNAREAAQLGALPAALMAQIESVLRVRLTARDTWLTIEGARTDTERAVRFYEALRKARNRDIWLGEPGIAYALRAFAEGCESDLEKLYDCRIAVGRGKPPVSPRTFGQMAYLRSITERDVAFGIGPAGTGKTYLAMAMAVSALLKEEVSRIVLTRPAIEAGEALGFLPGDYQQKVFPYLRPLYDALYDMVAPEDMERYVERGIIEVAPLAYMRGRTLNHAFVILDEAQNTTSEQMFMFLTRLGFDSKCVVTGDLTQIDLPSGRGSGLMEARLILKNVPEIGFTELGDADVVRHALVQKVIAAYREGRSPENGRPKENRSRPDRSR